MKTLTIIARILLGLIFVVFGLNGFLHFLPQPAMLDAAKSFFGALFASGYMLPLLFATQVVGGALVLLGMVPLGLLLLAPVIVNIIAFHTVLDPAGLPLAIVVAALALILAWSYREAFAPLFRMRGQA
jgi:putative oxidoreductase